MNRGNARQRIFLGPDDYQRFLDQVSYALEMDRVALYAYCLMPNHFHLLVETPDANIDQFVARFSTAYGMYFRYKRDRPGHCFQGRYKAPLVEGDDYLLRLTRYIHLNPVKTRSRAALSASEKWRILQDYRWSSLAGYMSRACEVDYIDYKWLGLLGSSAIQRRRYVAYMKQMLTADDTVLAAAMDSSCAIGDEEFRKEVKAWVEKQRGTGRAAGDVLLPLESPVSLGHIAQSVAYEFGITVRDLKTPRRRIGSARGVFVDLACRLGQCSQRDVASFLGSVSEHAVGKARREARRAMQDAPSLRQRVGRMEEHLKAKV